MIHNGLIDPQGIIQTAGPWALVGVCALVFVETGLLVGFFLPGDTLLFFTGVLSLTGHFAEPLWMIILAVVIAAVLGDQVGYAIGRRSGPAVFARRESGFFSRASVDRTERFFDRFGGSAVMVSRFVAVASAERAAHVHSGGDPAESRLFRMASEIMPYGIGHAAGHSSRRLRCGTSTQRTWRGMGRLRSAVRDVSSCHSRASQSQPRRRRVPRRPDALHLPEV
ncbi:hypothetical protein DOE76_11075 [Leifsonia sp. ku-ls]|nr:hypothetical protein DOE76_11075 [Leifsonia sp. ku-ls]